MKRSEPAMRSRTRVCPPVLCLLLAFGAAAGCAGKDLGNSHTVQRANADEALRRMKCRPGDRAVCTERMGELIECFCSSDAAFRKMLEF